MSRRQLQASQLDDLDMRIVAALQRNGRITNIEMARSLGVSEATIRNRMGRLLEEDLINIVAVPTPRAVGMTMSAIIGISVELDQLDQVLAMLSACPEVRYVGVATGRHDVMIEAFFFDQDHLLRFIAEQLGRSAGGEERRDVDHPQGGQVLLRVGAAAVGDEGRRGDSRAC